MLRDVRMVTIGGADTNEQVVGPSNRSFGLTLGVIVMLAGLLPLLRGGPARTWAVVAAAVLLALAFAWPSALAPANRLWLRVGLAMHRVMHPVVMGVLFYGVVTPFALLTRLFNRASVRRFRPDATLPTYWIAREGPPRMDRQF
jgi:hypothetical protein